MPLPRTTRHAATTHYPLGYLRRTSLHTGHVQVLLVSGCKDMSALGKAAYTDPVLLSHYPPDVVPVPPNMLVC